MTPLQNPPVRTALVLGARGFIGRHVCLELAAGGATVVGLGYGEWAPEEWRRWGLSRWVRSEIDLPALQALGDDFAPGAVIHCGGSAAVSASYADPLRDFHRSVDSTAAMLDWVRQSRGADCRVVLVSSAAVYGDQGDVDLGEMAIRSPVSPYGFHKLAAENLCDSYCRFFGVQASVVRLFSVYGEGLRKQLLWDALSKFAHGQSQFFGTGHELRDWLHVRDAARLLCAAAWAPQAAFEIFNGGHQHASTHDLLTRLARAAGSAVRPVFNGQTHTGNPRRLTANCMHARSRLGWVPQTGLDEGLARYAHWFANGAAEVPPAASA